MEPSKGRRELDSGGMLPLPAPQADMGASEASPPPMTETDGSSPEDSDMESPPEYPGSPSDMSAACSTLELLAAEGLSIGDVVTLQVGDELIKVIRKGYEWFEIRREVVGSVNTFRLVPASLDVRAAIVQHHSKAISEIRARTAAAVGSAYLGDIVDRPGDPGYREWVSRVLRPNVQGSPLVTTAAPRTGAVAEFDDGFWWMDNAWRERYRRETNLGQLVSYQVDVGVLIAIMS